MKIKIDVSQLKKGMYVCELDIPWTETSFLLQGVMVQGVEEITQLQEYCKFVYVDSEKSDATIAANLQTLSASPAPDSDNPGTSIANETKLAERETENFQKELRIAREIHTRTRVYIDQALEDVRLGQAVDTETAKELVTDIAASVARSPNAMLWLTNMKERDEYTSIHCMNVCVMAISFGRCLNMEKPELELLGLGGLLHDLGKMRVPLEILNKPSKLDAAEWEVMKTHPMEGYEMLSKQGGIPDVVLDIVKHHHERPNGQGYPDHMEGDLINNLTRMVAIVDVYDAITSDRCYHDAISPYDALKNMYEWVNEDFDREIVEKFIKCLGIYPIGSVVELNMGHVGIVVSASERRKLKPIVLLVMNSKKEMFPKPKLINLAHPKWSTGAQKLEVKRILNKDEYSFNMKSIIADESAI